MLKTVRSYSWGLSTLLSCPQHPTCMLKTLGSCIKLLSTPCQKQPAEVLQNKSWLPVDSEYTYSWGLSTLLSPPSPPRCMLKTVRSSSRRLSTRLSCIHHLTCMLKTVPSYSWGLSTLLSHLHPPRCMLKMVRSYRERLSTLRSCPHPLRCIMKPVHFCTKSWQRTGFCA